MKSILLTSLIFSLLALSSAPAQDVGQYELRRRDSGGFTAFGITLADDQVIGQVSGVPAAIPNPLSRGNHIGTQTLSTISDAGALAALNAVASAQITDGTIVNADISASAAIALSKLATDPLARANHTGTQAWSTITATPTTLSGYGITDAQPLNANLTALATGFGGFFFGSGLVQWNGTGYQLQSTAIPVTGGGTGLISGTVGGLLYFSSVTAIAQVTPNTTTTKKFLTQTGDVGVANPPNFSVLADRDVTFSDITTGNASTSSHGYLKKLDGTNTHFLDGSGNWSAIDLTSKVTGLLPVSNGGTGTSTPGIVAGTGISVSGTWPNQTVAVSGSGLTVGTTTITSGTSGRILYDNAGVFGELATTGTGNAVLATSSTLTTPTIADSNGNTILTTTTTASAVNYLAFTNAATGGNPTWTASGSDTNVGETHVNKGTGSFTVKAGTTSGNSQVWLNSSGTTKAFMRQDGNLSLSAGVGLNAIYDVNLNVILAGQAAIGSANGLYLNALQINGPASVSNVQSLSGAGAVNITTTLTKFTSTGSAQALTLADGTDGQIKIIEHTVAGGSGVLTPTTKTGFSSITFSAAGNSVILMFNTSVGWIIIASNGVTITP